MIMKKLKAVAYILFHLFVAVYSVTLFVGEATIVYAQEVRNYRLENLERQVADLQSQKLDERIVRIETVLMELSDAKQDARTQVWLNDAANGGVGLLLARAVYLAIQKNKEL